MAGLRVGSLNVLQGGEERFDRLLELIAAWRPDVLVLQECVDWDDGARLSAVARAIGVPATRPHAHLGLARPRGSGRQFHVAVLSRARLRDVIDHADPALVGHCIVECRIDTPGGDTLTVFGAHFDSHGEDLRMREASVVVERSAPLLGSGLAVLLGDLNALSRRDPYPADLAELLERAGTDKYGHPPRFDVIDAVERAGWIDTLYASPQPKAWVTAPRDRGGVRIDYRTDYVFASSPLAKRLGAARVVPVHGASDHEGVEASFDV